MVRDAGQQSQGGGAVQEELLEFGAEDVAGEVDEELAVVARAGDGAAVAALAAQDEIELGHVGAHLVRDAHLSQVGERIQYIGQ